jgi:hypothetical protein
MNKKLVRRNSRQFGSDRSGERGQGRLKFLIVMLVLFAIGYSLYLYVPIAYDGYVLKDYMQHEVDVAAAAGYDENWLKTQLTKSGKEYNLPENVEIVPARADGRWQLTVKYTRQIQFPGGYVYDYNFDQTVKSTQFLVGKQF